MFSTTRPIATPLIRTVARYSSDVRRLDPRESRPVARPSPKLHDVTYTPRSKGLLNPDNLTNVKLTKFLTSPFDLSLSGIASWFKRSTIAYHRQIQSYDPVRQDLLGSDISIGHALLPIGASLLYKGKPWMKYSRTSEYDLPFSPEEGWTLEAIDLSDSFISSEGFYSFQNLNQVHTIKAQNCDMIDDWCLDILCSQVLGLEHLDLSGCKRITPNGLTALTRLPNLRTLDLSNCPAFETPDGKLMCLLIQDYLIDLRIKGVKLQDVSDTDTAKAELSQVNV